MNNLTTILQRVASAFLVAAMTAGTVNAEDFDLTDLITNPSFESGFSGWTQSGMQTQNNTTFSLKEGKTYVERWVSKGNKAGDCSVTQTVSGLLPGDYTLKAGAQNIQQDDQTAQTGVVIFAGDNTTDVTAIDEYSVNFTVGPDGKIRLGFRATEATGNYLATDNYRITLTRYDNENGKTFVGNLCSEAEKLLSSKMTQSIAKSLTETMDAAKAAANQSEVANIVTYVKALRTLTTDAKTSIAAYKSLASQITRLTTASAEIKSTGLAAEITALLKDANTTNDDATATAEEVEAMVTRMKDAQTKIKAYASLGAAIDKLTEEYTKIQGQEGADKIAKLLEDSRKAFDQATATVDEVEAMTKEINDAIMLYNVAHSTAEAPVVTTHPYVARGATFAMGRSTVELPAGAQLLETGFCWSTLPEPTIADSRSTKVFNNNGKIYHLTGLQPSTVYYVRAYAVTKDYGVGYGDVVKVITIPMGTITWTYNSNGAPADAETRILAATKGAVDYWNQATSISGYHITVNYSPGTPTADCSYGGWIRMGANSSYQAIGTLMHEMNHGVGVGQLEMWTNYSSPYRQNSSPYYWLGQRTTDLIRFLENDATARLKGDNTHMWPYGINGAHEDNHTEMLYLANGMVTQALGEDALPPVSGRFHTPSYTFPSEDNVKYYIKVEDAERGAYTNFLVEEDGNKVNWKAMATVNATTDGHAAWYLTFDPVSCYYTLRNAATGNYLAMGNNSTLTTAAAESTGYTKDFQFTPAIKKVDVAGEQNLTYWITVAQQTATPRALTLNANGAPVLLGYSYTSKSANRQRWHIVPDTSLASFDAAASGVTTIDAEARSAVFPADVYDICGRLVKRNAENLDNLSSGIYIVNGRKFMVK